MGLGHHAFLNVYAWYLTKWFILGISNNPLSPFLYLGQDDHLDFTNTREYMRLAREKWTQDTWAEKFRTGKWEHWRIFLFEISRLISPSNVEQSPTDGQECSVCAHICVALLSSRFLSKCYLNSNLIHDIFPICLCIFYFL